MIDLKQADQFVFFTKHSIYYQEFYSQILKSSNSLHIEKHFTIVIYGNWFKITKRLAQRDKDKARSLLYPLLTVLHYLFLAKSIKILLND